MIGGYRPRAHGQTDAWAIAARRRGSRLCIYLHCPTPATDVQPSAGEHLLLIDPVSDHPELTMASDTSLLLDLGLARTAGHRVPSVMH